MKNKHLGSWGRGGGNTRGAPIDYHWVAPGRAKVLDNKVIVSSAAGAKIESFIEFRRRLKLSAVLEDCILYSTFGRINCTRMTLHTLDTVFPYSGIIKFINTVIVQLVPSPSLDFNPHPPAL